MTMISYLNNLKKFKNLNIPYIRRFSNFSRIQKKLLELEKEIYFFEENNKKYKSLNNRLKDIRDKFNSLNEIFKPSIINSIIQRDVDGVYDVVNSWNTDKINNKNCVHGEIPLVLACEIGDIRITKTLINTYKTEFEDGNKLLDICKKNGHDELYFYLKSFYEIKNKKDKDTLDKLREISKTSDEILNGPKKY